MRSCCNQSQKQLPSVAVKDANAEAVKSYIQFGLKLDSLGQISEKEILRALKLLANMSTWSRLGKKGAVNSVAISTTHVYAA